MQLPGKLRNYIKIKFYSINNSKATVLSSVLNYNIIAIHLALPVRSCQHVAST